MLLDSHASGAGGPGDGMVVQLGEDHQVCGEGGVDRESVTLLQSNLRVPFSSAAKCSEQRLVWFGVPSRLTLFHIPCGVLKVRNTIYAYNY
jgi:hypothetical protein